MACRRIENGQVPYLKSLKKEILGHPRKKWTHRWLEVIKATTAKKMEPRDALVRWVAC